MEQLIEQIKENKFTPLTFTLFNDLETHGDIAEMEGMFKRKFSVDDFEYLIFDLTEREKNSILYRNVKGMDKFNMLKRFIERDIQEDRNKSMSKINIDKNNGRVMLIKLYDFDIVEAIENEQSDEFFEEPTTLNK